MISESTPSDDEVLEAFQDWLNTSPLPKDIVSSDQAVGVMRAMAEFAGMPLTDLLVSEIRAFQKQLRHEFRPQGVATIGGNLATLRTLPPHSLSAQIQKHVALSGALLTAEFFLDFRKCVLSRRSQAR
jgi:hypothetical protein